MNRKPIVGEILLYNNRTNYRVVSIEGNHWFVQRLNPDGSDHAASTDEIIGWAILSFFEPVSPYTDGLDNWV